MKKIFTVIFVLFLALDFLAFAGTHGRRRSGLSNPLKETTLEQLKEKGFEFNIPEEACEISCFTISDETADVRFSWNCIPCNLRIKASEKLEDISGFHYSWEKIFHEEINGFESVEKYVTDSSGNIQAAALMFDGKKSWSFTMTVPGIGPGETEDVKELLKKLLGESYAAAGMEGLRSKCGSTEPQAGPGTPVLQ